MEAGMTERVSARWYFDVISPYAYLYWKRFGELRPVLDIELAPILFAGLLKHWDNKGPAEIAPKRVHTYRNCVWLAEQHAIPFRLPPLHPFNPLQIQRLLVALGSTPQAIGTVFDFIWREGRDPGEEWSGLCDRLSLNPAEAVKLIADPAVKQRLVTNTATAADSGVFGVPTLSLRNENFWGCEMIGLVNAFVDDPDKFQTGEMKRVGEIGIGAIRKESA
jgi:2-hydroxychromene-2-carboxylate isomerase